MEDREEFVGGVNRVVREGALVRRPAGPWSATVQRLLGHLAASGFDGSPRPHGLTADGTEELVEFLPGGIGHDFAAPEVRSDASLVAVARLLRRMHDASADFPRTPGDVWHLPPREPVEVICHGDAATYNTVFRDGLPVAFIDFDTAHPAPRLWDAAYTAYRFVPLYAPDEVALTIPPAEAFRRLAIFADAYGFTSDERVALPAVAVEKLHDLVAYMHAQADAGSAAFAGHIAEGHDRRYVADAAWIEAVFAGVLRTKRLILRPARPADLDWLHAHWTTPHVREFLYDNEVLTRAQVSAEIDAGGSSFAAAGHGLWLIECIDASIEAGDVAVPLGAIGLRPLDELGLEVYYSLAPEAWGDGYATEAARAVVDHALGTLGIPEVLAEVDEGNAASSSVIEKLGFTVFDTVPGVLGPMNRYRRIR